MAYINAMVEMTAIYWGHYSWGRILYFKTCRKSCFESVTWIKYGNPLHFELELP